MQIESRHLYYLPKSVELAACNTDNVNESSINVFLEP